MGSRPFGPSKDVAEIRKDGWGYYEVCQAEILYNPDVTQYFFYEPFSLVPGGWVADYEIESDQSSMWTLICWNEYRDGPPSVQPTIFTESSGGLPPTTGTLLYSPMKVSDCNYEMYTDTSGRWIRDSLMRCSRPHFDSEKADLDSSMTLFFTDTSDTQQFTNDSAKKECMQIKSWTEQALNDIKIINNIAIWVGNKDGGYHGGSSVLGGGVGHIDPRKFYRVLLANVQYALSPNSTNAYNLLLARRELLRSLAHEAIHAYGNEDHDFTPQNDPYFSRIESHGLNQCIK
jgi:hypothetical protein